MEGRPNPNLAAKISAAKLDEIIENWKITGTFTML